MLDGKKKRRSRRLPRLFGGALFGGSVPASTAQQSATFSRDPAERRRAPNSKLVDGDTKTKR
jgi:hypothetical protein